LKFEYRVLNLSEVKARSNDQVKVLLIDVMNFYGEDGWEILFKLTDSSFLMKRMVPDDALPR
jgi:hypothetical protein